MDVPTACDHYAARPGRGAPRLSVRPYRAEKALGARLRGREMFLGIVLTNGEETFAMRKVEDVVHDVAGHLGGMIKRRRPGDGSRSEGSGSD